jgi:hypothetical protein
MSSQDELKEKLAEIEHERWSDWQRYLHSKCVPEERTESTGTFLTGNVLIPKALFERWERQINTKYKDLSAEEKESDRREVERYWKFIAELLKY